MILKWFLSLLLLLVLLLLLLLFCVQPYALGTVCAGSSLQMVDGRWLFARERK
jgi:hypothetical protein